MEEKNTKPDCFTSEENVLYPLCVGNNEEKCIHCCLWVDWNEASWQEE